jgi:hypothetical protein
MEEGFQINKTQAAITIISTGLGLGLLTKFALNKTIGISVIAGIVGLGIGFIIDTQLQKHFH